MANGIQAAPAGWYSDPTGSGQQRWFDGAEWTDAYQAPRPAEHKASNGLVIAGYCFAAFMPLVGFIIGIVLLAKGRTGHGIGCIAVSVVAFFIWLAILIPGGSDGVCSYNETVRGLNGC